MICPCPSPCHCRHRHPCHPPSWSDGHRPTWKNPCRPWPPYSWTCNYQYRSNPADSHGWNRNDKKHAIFRLEVDTIPKFMRRVMVLPPLTYGRLLPCKRNSLHQFGGFCDGQSPPTAASNTAKNRSKFRNDSCLFYEANLLTDGSDAPDQGPIALDTMGLSFGICVQPGEKYRSRNPPDHFRTTFS